MGIRSYNGRTGGVGVLGRASFWRTAQSSPVACFAEGTPRTLNYGIPGAAATEGSGKRCILKVERVLMAIRVNHSMPANVRDQCFVLDGADTTQIPRDPLKRFMGVGVVEAHGCRIVQVPAGMMKVSA